MCAQQADEPDPAPTSLCLVCRKEIPVGASKCTECDSFQNWRRYLVEWTGFGAAVLAIVPLWGSAVSLYRIAFPEAANVAVSIANCSPSEISAFILNQGGESAIVAPPTIMLRRVAGSADKMTVSFSLNDDAKVIEASEVDVVTLNLGQGREFPTKEPDDPLCELTVSFPITTLDGASSTRSGVCQCPAAN